MPFHDYFSTQAKTYSKYRPSYPGELFHFLSSVCVVHDLAWDCATGNGQAAISLAQYFNKVIATDGSKQQLENAMQHPKVQYKIALAEESGIESNSIDLVTVAAAVHWLNFEKFYAEVNRVLKPTGIIAIWSYTDSAIIDEKINAILKRFSRELLLNYWPPETAHVFNKYRDIPFPFNPIETPDFKIVRMMKFEDIIGLLYSWSSTQQYIKATGKSPVDIIKKELEDAWGDLNMEKQISWQLVLKVGKMRV